LIMNLKKLSKITDASNPAEARYEYVKPIDEFIDKEFHRFAGLWIDYGSDQVQLDIAQWWYPMSKQFGKDYGAKNEKDFVENVVKPALLQFLDENGYKYEDISNKGYKKQGSSTYPVVLVDASEATQSLNEPVSKAEGDHTVNYVWATDGWFRLCGGERLAVVEALKEHGWWDEDDDYDSVAYDYTDDGVENYDYIIYWYDEGKSESWWFSADSLEAAIAEVYNHIDDYRDSDNLDEENLETEENYVEIGDSLKIQDSDWESQLWDAINAGKRDFTITIDPDELEADQLEDYIAEGLADIGDSSPVSVVINGTQAKVHIAPQNELKKQKSNKREKLESLLEYLKGSEFSEFTNGMELQHSGRDYWLAGLKSSVSDFWDKWESFRDFVYDYDSALNVSHYQDGFSIFY